MVHLQVCCQGLRNRRLGMPDLENYRFAERLAYVARSSFSDIFPSLKVDVSLVAKHCLSEHTLKPFATFLGRVIFLGHERNRVGN